MSALSTPPPPDLTPPPHASPLPAVLAPVARAEREPLLDVLRGLALFIVLFNNTVDCFSGSRYLPETSPNYIPDDSLPGMIFRFVLSDRAMTVMAMLFGVGFAIQLERAQAIGANVVPMYLRRLGVMFALGVCHTLVWWGDILGLYALAGLALLPFRHLRTKWLILLGLLLAILPRVLVQIPAVRAIAAADFASEENAGADVLRAMYGTDYASIFFAQVRLSWVHHGRNAPWLVPCFAGRFVLGMAAWRTGLFHQRTLADRPQIFRTLFSGGLAISVANAAFRTAVVGRHPKHMALALKMLVVLSGQIAIIASVAAGVSLVVFAMQRARLRGWLERLVPVGRTPLTTYLAQSVISTFLFYGWGLGLVRWVQGLKSGPVAVCVFALQIALATLWLRRYRVGPVEWLWRTLAYRRRQPMRP